MALERLWAGWRIRYVETADADAPPPVDGGGTLFERILGSGLPDDETLIVWRGEHCFALLNLYPYSNGHLMVLPTRPVRELDELSDDEHAELWQGVRAATVALKRAYSPDGINVGVNQGRGSGAGVPDHLHVHVLPRWAGDTNFMTTVAETRVLPEALDATWEKVRAAWPSDPGDSEPGR
jgi:diadenosine tetraphosphate (Ap4A) HIT family hydrolase